MEISSLIKLLIEIRIYSNAALAIAGGIRGISKEKLFQEVGFESLQSRRWFQKFRYLQNNKKQIIIISLSSNSKAMNFIFYL